MNLVVLLASLLLCITPALSQSTSAQSTSAPEPTSTKQASASARDPADYYAFQAAQNASFLASVLLNSDAPAQYDPSVDVWLSELERKKTGFNGQLWKSGHQRSSMIGHVICSYALIGMKR